MLIRRDKSDLDARERSRGLRRDSTPPERVLWRWLRDRRLGGLKFRRQQPIGAYVVDFFCAEAKLVVEIDSAYHEGAERKARDERRDQALGKLGVKTLRFSASTLAKDRDAVLATILREAKERMKRE